MARCARVPSHGVRGLPSNEGTAAREGRIPSRRLPAEGTTGTFLDRLGRENIVGEIDGALAKAQEILEQKALEARSARSLFSRHPPCWQANFREVEFIPPKVMAQLMQVSGIDLLLEIVSRLRARFLNAF